jgi:hypothetical protein
MEMRRRSVLLALSQILVVLAAVPAGAAPLSPQAAATLRVPGSAAVSSPLSQRAITRRDILPQSTAALGDSNGAWFTIGPPRRIEHTATYDPVRDRMIVFGGSTATGGAPAITLSLQGEPVWAPLQVTGTSPPVTSGYAAFYDSSSDRMIAFGGNDLYQAPKGFVWQLNLSGSPHWSPLGVMPTGDRDGPAVAMDTRRHRLIVFGGMRDTTILNDVWTFDLNGVAGWTQIETKGESPTPRWSSHAVYDPEGDRFLVFGGAVPIAPHILDGTNETLALNLADSTWSRADTTGPLPSQYTTAVPVYDPIGHQVVLVGHGDESAEAVFALSLGDTLRWSELTSTGQLPPVRNGQTGVYDGQRDRILVFGGQLDPTDNVGVDVLTLRPQPTWGRMSSVELPKARFGHATIHDWKRDRFVFFGGVTSDTFFGDLTPTNETWSVSLSDLKDAERLTPAGDPPAPRHEPVGIYDPIGDRGIFFGGWTYPENYFNDTWILSFENGPVWTQVTPQGDPPPARRGSTAVYDPVRRRMLLYAGADSSEEFGDLWALHLDEPMRWEQLEPQGPAPHGRFLPSFTYDPLRDRVIAYGGGYGYGSTNEIWSLEMSDTLRWVQLTPRGYAPALERHGAVYDPATDRLLIHGGWDIDYDELFVNDSAISMSLDDRPAFEQLRPSGDWPDPRAGESAVFDLARDRLVIWGGTDFGFSFNDTWDLQFDTTTRPAWLVSAKALPGDVSMQWHVAGNGGLMAKLYRRLGDGPWTSVAVTNSDANGTASFEDRSVGLGEQYQYRVSVSATGTEQFSDPITVLVPGGSGIVLLGARPNPAVTSASEIAFWLPDASQARLEVFDTRGRKVWGSEIGGLGKGMHRIPLDTIRESGVYFARLTHGADVQSTRFVTLR